MPPTSPDAARLGARDRDRRSSWRMPQSWRPVVRTAIDRLGSAAHAVPTSSARPSRRPRTPRPVRRPTSSCLRAGRCRSRVAGREVALGDDVSPPARSEPSAGSAARRRRSRARPRSGPCRRRRGVASWPGWPRPSPRSSVGSSDDRVVRPATRPIERQVLLDERGAERRPRRSRTLDAGRVVRPADRDARTRRASSRSRARFASAGAAGIARHAVEQRERRVAGARTVSTAAATSTMSPCPVETQHRAATRAPAARGSGRLVSSPDADLERRHVQRVEEVGRGRRRTASRGSTMPRSWACALQARPRPRRAGRSRGEHRALVRRPQSPARWYAAVGASAEARASGSKVWNLTASAPASAAASMSAVRDRRVAVVVDAGLGDDEDRIRAPMSRSPSGTGADRSRREECLGVREVDSSYRCRWRARRRHDEPSVRPGSTNRRVSARARRGRRRRTRRSAGAGSVSPSPTSIGGACRRRSDP